MSTEVCFTGEFALGIDPSGRLATLDTSGTTRLIRATTTGPGERAARCADGRRVALATPFRALRDRAFDHR